MYCTNCGNKLNDGNIFCINCRAKVENPNIQINSNISKRGKNINGFQWKPIVLTIIIIILGICAIRLLINKAIGYRGTPHRYKDFVNYLDNLECNINGKEYSCNLKDKYEVINDEYGYKDFTYGDSSKKARIITFKIKNTDLKFTVSSGYFGCAIDFFDGSCLKKTYDLTDDFNISAFKYYLEEYSKLIGYDNRYCYLFDEEDTDCYPGAFVIKTYSDLEYVINYMNGFLDYISKLDFKFVYDYLGDFKLVFEDESSIFINLDIQNDMYTYEFTYNEYKPEDGTIETYIKNYMNAKGIALE